MNETVRQSRVEKLSFVEHSNLNVSSYRRENLAKAAYSYLGKLVFHVAYRISPTLILCSAPDVRCIDETISMSCLIVQTELSWRSIFT